jgi:predicted hotdog family 3-hydroxylacyl-ACP dehydratase
MTDDVPLESFMPHRAPMLLLDEVIERDASSIVCRARVDGGSPFVCEGSMPAVVLLEHMAQATAAWLGLRALERGDPIVAGMLAGARRLELDVDVLEVGDELEVRAEHVWGEDGLASFSCEVRRGGVRVAAASVSVQAGARCP